MRIDGFQNIPSVLQSYGSTGAGKTDQSQNSDSPSASVSLSSFAEVFQSIQRDSLQASQANAARVEQLAQQEASGKLSVNIEKLASNLVESNVIDVQG